VTAPDGVPLTRREALARERAALAATSSPALTSSSRSPVSSRPAPVSTPTPAAASTRATVAVRPRRVPVVAEPTRASSSSRASSTPPVARASASKAARRLRAAAVPALAFVASALFFSSNVTPATASDLGGSVVQTSAAAPVPGQTLAASLVVLTVSERDAFVVKDAPPPPPPPPVVVPKTESRTSNATSTRSGGVAAGGGTIVNSGTGDIRWPFPGSVVLSSGFGPRAAPCAACSSMHMGLDMTPGSGTPIGAVAAGTVRTSGMHAQFGQYAVIDHVIDGQKISTLYAHMVVGSSPLVVGQQVAVGELVGLVGRSGVATGAHLHFEVLIGGSTQVDPRAWLDANAGRTL
jgi:murein DD-endopeptidase MepM/ murein hydrolase activator NlpD